MDVNLEMVLTACAVVAVRRPAATSVVHRSQWALSQHGRIDLGDAGECVCRYGSGSGLCDHSRHTAVGKGRALPCGYAAASGWS